MLGAEPIRLLLGEGGTRLNPLDPMILAGTGTTGQLQLLAAMAAEAAGGATLTPWEMGAMRASHRQVLRASDLGVLSTPGHANGAEPTLEDLVSTLGQDLPDYRESAAVLPRPRHRGRRRAAFHLRRDAGRIRRAVRRADITGRAAGRGR